MFNLYVYAISAINLEFFGRFPPYFSEITSKMKLIHLIIEELNYLHTDWQSRFYEI